MSRMIGLDLGTTTVTGVLFDFGRAEIECLALRRNDAALPVSSITRAEQGPHRLHTLALEVLAELAATGGPVDGIALTGQMHGLLCVDAENRPLSPLISWQDRRTAELLPPGRAEVLPGLLGDSQTPAMPTGLDRLHACLSGLDWRPNGCRIHHGYGAATLFWLVQWAALPPGTCRVCTIVDWLAGQLTTRLPVTDPTLAASWGVYDLAHGVWNQAFLECLGLEPGLLPPVLPSGERLGGLAPDAANRVGLPAGTPVHNALGDNQAAFLGSAPSLARLPGAGQDLILINLGTGGQVCWAVPGFEPPGERVETRPLPGPGGSTGGFLRVGASLCGGAAYAWLNDTVRAWLAEFGLDLGKEAVYRRLDELATECGDARGLRVRPTFLGVRGDREGERGEIAGITLENLRLGSLARATMIGLVDELRDLYEMDREQAKGHGRVIAAGGAVEKNPLLSGIVEARFGLPVSMPPWRETAAVGAALCAATRPGR